VAAARWETEFRRLLDVTDVTPSAGAISEKDPARQIALEASGEVS
jgi:hypothetical protein